MEQKLWEIVLKNITYTNYNIEPFLKIKEKMIKINYNDYDYELIDKKNSNIDKSIIDDNDYISDNIKLYITNKINRLEVYYINNSKLYLYYENNYDKNIIDKLFKIFNLVTKYFNFNEKREIHIFLTPYRKKFYGDIDTIKKENINSGLTYVMDGKIIVYRLEELEKVFIHELIHSMKIDKGIKDINLDLNTDKDITLHETFTEIIAEIIYYIYLHLEYKINLKKIIDLEYKFSIFQSIKLLKIFDYDKIEDLLYKNDKKLYKDETNSIEYFILKTYIICNMDYFMNNFFENGYFKQPFNIELFEDFIRKLKVNKNFKENINKNFKNYAFINSNKMVLIDKLYK